MEKFKIYLSVLFGAIFLVAGSYQFVLNALYLTDKEVDYTLSLTLLGLSLIFFYGRLKVLAKSIQSGVSSIINKRT